jgi:hypothetical protein
MKMKILITILMTLFISSTAYSQSATRIITKGKIIEGATYETWERDKNDSFQSHHSMVVLYNLEIYFCTIGTEKMACKKPRDLGVLTDE